MRRKRRRARSSFGLITWRGLVKRIGVTGAVKARRKGFVKRGYGGMWHVNKKFFQRIGGHGVVRRRRTIYRRRKTIFDDRPYNLKTGRREGRKSGWKNGRRRRKSTTKRYAKRFARRSRDSEGRFRRR